MNLKSLSDKLLLSQTLSLVQKEREILVQVLWHLKEIDQRKLYSDLKCSSLFDYCVKILKYSEGQAGRRVSATRLLRDIPVIAAEISKGAINLTQLNQAKSFFDEMKIEKASEKVTIVMELSGKSTRESERMLWEKKGENTPKRVNLSLEEKTVMGLKHVQSLNSHKCSDMDKLLLAMCVEVEKVWVPQVKRNSTGGQIDKRYVSVAVKAKVWERDQGKCVQCGSKMRLELDHIKPFAVGGKTEIQNMRLLCRNCNQRAGVKYFGARA